MTYFIAEVFDASAMTHSVEHIVDASGCWYSWGSFDQISHLLRHAKTQRLFAEATHGFVVAKWIGPDRILITKRIRTRAVVQAAASILASGCEGQPDGIRSRGWSWIS